MKRTSWSIAAAVVIGASGCAPQQAAVARKTAPISAPLSLCTPTDAPSEEIGSKPGYVQYAVTVTDASGNPVRGLKASDFVVKAGDRSVPIGFFREDDGDAPESIVIVVDESGSMVNKLAVSDIGDLERVRENIQGATRTLNKCDEIAGVAVGGHPADEPVDKDDGIRVIQPFTTDDQAALERAFYQMAWGETPLYDGIDKGLEVAESAHYSNRALIVITDGIDNTSKDKAEKVLDRAEREGIRIYAIGMGDPNAKEPKVPANTIQFFVPSRDADAANEKTLEALSGPSGGQYAMASELRKDAGESFVAAIEKLNGALGYEYSIGLIGPVSKGQPIRIELANAGANRVMAAKEVQVVAYQRPPSTQVRNSN
jgi:VWFA-related protein